MLVKLKEKDKKPLLSSPIVARLLENVLATEDKLDQEKEHFWVIGLDARNCIKYLDLVSLGSLDANLVHPREVFRLAVHKGTAQLLIAHNHPSGHLEPSENDITITKRLEKAGDLLGIKVIDHIIIGNGQGYTSLKANRIMGSK